MRGKATQYLCEFATFILGVYGERFFTQVQMIIASIDSGVFSWACMAVAFYILWKKMHSG